MLLRSASAPILKSWANEPVQKVLRSIMDAHPISRGRSISLVASCSMLSVLESHDEPFHRMSKFSSGSHLDDRISNVMSVVPLGEEDKDDNGVQNVNNLLLIGSGGNGGGKYWGFGGSEDSDSNHNRDNNADMYYEQMIDANPGNPLFVGNYARFLKEIRGDNIKAEEYCERAILENADDGNVLSMYADLIWENHKDAPRAEGYFDRAVTASPDNCYVLASYAHFLWDSDATEMEGHRSFDVEVNALATAA